MRLVSVEESSWTETPSAKIAASKGTRQNNYNPQKIIFFYGRAIKAVLIAWPLKNK